MTRVILGNGPFRGSPGWRKIASRAVGWRRPDVAMTFEVEGSRTQAPMAINNVLNGLAVGHVRSFELVTRRRLYSFVGPKGTFCRMPLRLSTFAAPPMRKILEAVDHPGVRAARVTICDKEEGIIFFEASLLESDLDNKNSGCLFSVNGDIRRMEGQSRFSTWLCHEIVRIMEIDPSAYDDCFICAAGMQVGHAKNPIVNRVLSGRRGSRFVARAEGVISTCDVSLALADAIEKGILVSARIGLSPLAGICGPIEIDCPTRMKVRLSVGGWDVSTQIETNIEESLNVMIEREALVEGRIWPRIG